MKPNFQSLRKPERRGIALLTVLALLTLTAVLILAFFSISQTELRSTAAYAGGAEAQELSKTAVDLVMHQIRAATQDSGTAWASQPGAIRVWGKNQGSETVAAYKLYSDDQMTVREPLTGTDGAPASFDRALFQDTQEMRDWWDTENKDVFVDLNEPLLRAGTDQAGRERTKVYYPIVDPRAYYKGSQKQTVTRSDWETPSDSQEDRKREVEGFFFETTTVERGPYPRKNGEKVDHHVGLPMPVKWLYQLKDGTLGTLDRGQLRPKFKAVSGDGVPSQNNPMVGRIAFWADDETCKLNVNTAAGGSPWDTPRAGGRTDREDFAAKPPVQKEWQRYPAHPATTSLAPVIFPNRNRAGEGSKLGRAAAMDVATAHEKIYTMIPRVEPGGSAGGLDFWKTDKPPIVAADRDRLYATIDEFLFHATKKSSQGLREPQEAAGSWGQLDGDFLDRTKFFLTTSSRAPEVTVFNTPRISVWPTHYEQSYSAYNNSRYLTRFDKQIRFCAEVGRRNNNFGDQYHFQRKNADSPTEDYTGIQRNQELFAYLLWLMKQPIPGVGKSLESKYDQSGANGETQQIATEIFDYIRSTNLFDDMVFEDNAERSETGWKENPANHSAYTNNRIKPSNNAERGQVHSGHGQVTPIEITKDGITTKGFGRFFGINEVGIAFIATASVDDDDEVLGGKIIYNYRDLESKWETAPGTKLFDCTNVPPFSRKDLLEWDGHTLDPKNPADQQLITDQSFVATKYSSANNGVPPNYTAFIGKKDLWNYIRDPRNWNYTLERDKPLKNKGERQVQAILLFSMFCPSKGWTAINPDFRMEVNITDSFKVESAGTSIDLFPASSLRPNPFTIRTLATAPRYHDQRPMGGILEPRAFLVGQKDTGSSLLNQMPRYTPDVERWRSEMISDGYSFAPREGPSDDSITYYPWISDPFYVPAGGFTFSGGQVEMKVQSGGGFNSAHGDGDGSDPMSQFVRIKMKSCNLPSPNIVRSYRGRTDRGINSTYSQTNPREHWCFSREGCFTLSPQGLEPQGGPNKRPPMGRFMFYNSDPDYNGGVIVGVKGDLPPLLTNKHDVVRSYVIPHGDYRVALAKKASNPSTPDLTSEGAYPDFVPHTGYDDTSVYSACAFTTAARSRSYGWNELHYEWSGSARRNRNPLAKTPGPDFNRSLEPPVPKNIEDKTEYQSHWGDWDNTTATETDGPFINKPDEGNSKGISLSNWVSDHWRHLPFAPRQYIPYFSEPHQQEPPGASFFSPNRIMPGAGLLGSLPTGVKSNRPWQTLLFRPLPNNGRSLTGGLTHPGYQDPKDHYLLDFFWMPVVEPWSISEPFSTAGKVNLNYAMVPFAHIKRASAIIGAMFSEQMLTIPGDQQNAYKVWWGFGDNYNWITDTGGTLNTPSLRSFIDHKETLKQFDERFNSRELSDFRGRGDLFRTASELCELWLVPDPVLAPDNSILKRDFTRDNVESFWNQNNENGFTLVGDNSRERPYAVLLPRLTTKSNTFQVHYRAQIIKQAPTSPDRPGERRRDDEYETFDSDVDGVIAEYRGSTTIERYIDPNEQLDTASGVPDYAELAFQGNLRLGNFEALDKFYRFRVVSEKRFAP